jgi:hypothetical protein
VQRISDAKAAEAAQSAYYDPNQPQCAYVPPPAYYVSTAYWPVNLCNLVFGGHIHTQLAASLKVSSFEYGKVLYNSQKESNFWEANSHLTNQ